MTDAGAEAPVRWARKLAPRQQAELHVFDVATNRSTHIYTSDRCLFEAPNWHPDGQYIVVNADGLLYRIDVLDPTALQQIPAEGLPELNNDHLISPDGRWHFVSANDGHLYRLPWEGGKAQRVTTPKPEGRKFRHFLHGISPDGKTLAYVGTETENGDEWGRRALWLLDLETGNETLLGDGFSPADGPDFSANGDFIYFNSEYRSELEGHAQLFRIESATKSVKQLTSDERVNWFPHPSPDGRHLSYLSYQPGTLGHPADRQVKLKMIDLGDGTSRDLLSLHGGQGTINVTSWAPDSERFAYVAYPISD